MSSAYSVRSSSVRCCALVGVLDRLQLVEVDGVDRRLRAHHGDRRARQREAAVGLEGRAGHRVEPGAVGLAHDDRDLRHGRLADGADHLRAVADDALALDLRADHEARHVGEEQQRHVERVARPDEARRLVGRVDEQHAALVLRLVGDDPDRPARRGARSRRSAPWPSARGSRAASPRRRARRSAPSCRTACSRRRGSARRSTARPPARRAAGEAGGAACSQLPGK